MTRIRPAAWLIAAVALFLLAVAGYALLVHASPESYWKQIDTAVYRDGGIAVRHHPAMLYSLGLGATKLPFTYTPFAALLFAAGSGASFATWQVGLVVLTIGLLPGVAYLSLGLAGRPAGLDRAAAAFATAAVGLWLEPVAMTLFFGQINLVLLALVVADLALPDRIKGKGIATGLAAGIKLTPLIFIPYLLFTRRPKAAAVSAVTFAVTVGIGFALLPNASAVFWGGKITRPGSKPFHLPNQSLNGVILRLTDAGPDAHRYWLVAVVVVSIAGLATSILATRRGHKLFGLVACAATSLLVSPISWSHHYVYVVPALVLAACGPRRLGYRVLGAALVVGLFGWWPVPLGSQGGYVPKAPPRGLLLLAPNRGNYGADEFNWRGLQLIVGNYYVLTLLLFLTATACALALTRRLGPKRAHPSLRARPRVGGRLADPCEPGMAARYSDLVPARLGAVRRFGLPLLRPAAGLAILWFLWHRVGGAPFRAGLGAVTWPAVLVAVGITAATTVCSAWRWQAAARALGLDITMPAAFGAYYRSLFLNSVLVGGVLGDVHRAVTHGGRAGHMARGVRAVAWERLWGQVVQAAVTAVLLVAFTSPLRPVLPYVLAGVAAATGCVTALVWAAARWGGAWLGRTARAACDDLRCGLLARGVWIRLTMASVLVVVGHTVVFVMAARVAGSAAPLSELLVLLMVVQVAAVIPLSIGGWGLREGAAAWVFSAAGFGAGTGVTVTSLYALLMLIAFAPGAALLLGDAVRRHRGRRDSARGGSGPSLTPAMRSPALAARVLERAEPSRAGLADD